MAPYETMAHPRAMVRWFDNTNLRRRITHLRDNQHGFCVLHGKEPARTTGPRERKLPGYLPVDKDISPKRVSCHFHLGGDEHTCAVLQNGCVCCWGTFQTPDQMTRAAFLAWWSFPRDTEFCNFGFCWNKPHMRRIGERFSDVLGHRHQ